MLSFSLLVVESYYTRISSVHLHLQSRVWPIWNLRFERCGRCSYKWVMSSCRSYFCFSCLLLLTTPLPAFWPDFYISFICELSTVGGGRRGILLSLYTSILTTHHSPPFWLFSHFSCTNDNVDVDDERNDNVCSPMFTNDYPPVLASQSELCRNTTMTMMAKKNYFSDTDE